MISPIETLFSEHETIISAINISKQANTLIGKNDGLYDKTIRELIKFFRDYADRMHHHKEEEILFPAMADKNEMLGDGVIKEMLENHEDFRSILKNIETNLDNSKYDLARQNLSIYTEALLDHIAVENDEVFQMAESLFNENELDNIYYRFEDYDRESGNSKKQELIAMLGKIEEEITRGA